MVSWNAMLRVAVPPAALALGWLQPAVRAPEQLGRGMERHELRRVGRVARHALDGQVAGPVPRQEMLARDERGADVHHQRVWRLLVREDRSAREIERQD